jgi:hypothetical protein
VREDREREGTARQTHHNAGAAAYHIPDG